MNTRLDSLFALLGKDSSAAARKAAAQQIGEVQKSHPYDLQNLLERAHYYLQSAHWDTRIAASQAIEAIVSYVPKWEPKEEVKDEKVAVKMETDESSAAPTKPDHKALGRLTLENFDVRLIMDNGKTLLASEGLEFERNAAVMSPEELARQREQILRELRLSPEDMDFIEEEDLKATTSSNSMAVDMKPKDEAKSAAIEESFASSRMRNLAKRQQKAAAERPQMLSAASVSSNDAAKKTKTVVTDQPKTDDKVVIESVLDIDRAFEDVNEWPLERFCDELCLEIFDKKWQVRHGAAMGLREILKRHAEGAGKRLDTPLATQNEENRAWFVDCAIRLICVMMLDRFADFSGDQPIAHVREACAQVLAILMNKMHDEDLSMIFDRIVIMVNESDNWEVRHSAFLILKYLVSVRPSFAEAHMQALLDVLFEGLDDIEADVKAVAADAMLPLLKSNLRSDTSLKILELTAIVTTETCTKLLAVLSALLIELDDVSSATNNVMILLASLCTIIGENPGLVTTLDASHLIPTLFPFFRHAVRSVRYSVLNMISTLLASERATAHLWLSTVAGTLFQLLFQNLLLEEDEQIVALTHSTWNSLVSQTSALQVNIPIQVQQEDGSILEQESLSTLTSAIVPADVLISWFRLLSSPLERAIDPAVLLHVPFPNQDAADSSAGVSDRKTVTSQCYENLCTALASFVSIAKEYTDLFVQIVQAMVTGLTGCERIGGSYLVVKWASLMAEPTGEDPFTIGFPEALWTLFLDCADKWESQFYFSETESLMTSMRMDCKKLIQTFNDNGVKFDLGVAAEEMSVDQGKELFNVTFDKLIGHVRDVPKPGVSTLASQELKGLRVRAQGAIEHLEFTQHSLNVTSTTMIASAVVAMSHATMKNPNAPSRKTPRSLNPILKPILQALTHQSDLNFQTAASLSIASLTHLLTTMPKPRELTISRIAALLFANPASIPALTFANEIEASLIAAATTKAKGKAGANNSKKRKTLSDRMTDADLDESSGDDEAGGNDEAGNGGKSETNGNKKAKTSETPTPETTSVTATAAAAAASKASELSNNGKRGAELALVWMAKLHGATLFDDLPSLWQLIYAPLAAAQEDEPTLSKSALIIMTLAPHVVDSLKNKFLGLVELLVRRVSSASLQIRALAAQAIASIVRYTAPLSMNVLVTHVLPVLQDAANANARRGAALTLHACIETLELEVLPYLIFLIVPVLGRMSDQDDVVRKTMSFSFATLVKLMPLEARVPNPKDMPESLVVQREKERVFLEQLLGGRKVDAYELPIKISTELRAYQQEGVNWLAFLNKYNLHGILADDMGLGKTLQTLCILNSDNVHRAEMFSKTRSPEFKPLPGLIVCPPILVPHWEGEVRRFCDASIKVAQYKGSTQERAAIRNKAHEFQMIVTSYDVLRNDIEALSAIQFNYCVLDEGHIIRNAKTKLTQAVKRVRANHRLILSGTPIQNNVLELWSLFDFLMPGFLGSERQFMAAYSKPVMASRDASASSKEQEKGTMALEALHRQVLPFILRRMKEDVLHDLPPKIIQDVNVELSPLQLKLYNDFSKNNSPGDDDDSKHVFQALQYLRKLVSHPKLVVSPTHPKHAEVTSSLAAEGRTLDDYTLSPKLVALKELLLSCGIGSEKTGMDAGITQNRVLIFTQLKQMLDIVEKDLFQKDMPLVSYLRLDGDVPQGSRMPIVERFNSNPSIDVLLLTVSVGGLGLNLTGANTVIFLEHDWNPQNDIQAMDRVHRIGQKKTVNVYRLITRGTLEEKIMGLQRFKLQIANSIVNKENQSFQSMDTSQLLDLFNVVDGDKKSAGANGDGLDEFGNVIAGDSSKKSAEQKGLKGMLDSLEELGDQSRYAEEYDLDNLVSQLR